MQQTSELGFPKLDDCGYHSQWQKLPTHPVCKAEGLTAVASRRARATERTSQYVIGFDGSRTYS
jgi:hypothetical protein